MSNASSNAAAATAEAGRALPRPGWVRWIAQDANGDWWGYSVEPLRNDSGWYENEVGCYVRLGRSAADGWERSLQAVMLSD